MITKSKLQSLAVICGMLVATAMSANTTKADCILTLEQVAPGAILVDTERLFRLSIRSNGGPLADVAGIDFTIAANDPSAAGDVTTGGQFVSGTNELFPFATYSVPFPTSVMFFASVGDSVSIATTDTTLAYFTLSTVGALPGTYNMQLLGSVIIRDSFDTYNVIQGNPGGMLPYTIFSVPEPTAVAYLLLVVGGAAGWKSRRAGRIGRDRVSQQVEIGPRRFE